MAKIRRKTLTTALLEMLQRVRDTGDPWGGEFYGGRLNVFRAAIKGGWLEAGTSELTEEGRQVLAAWERRREAA